MKCNRSLCAGLHGKAVNTAGQRKVGYPQKLLGPYWEKISMPKMEIMPIGRTRENLGFFAEGLSLWEDKENWCSSGQKCIDFPSPKKGYEWTTTVWNCFHQNQTHFLSIVQLGSTRGAFISQRTACPCSYFWAFSQGKSYLEDFIIILSSSPNTAAVDLFL